jgi:hypothetical protein
MCVYDESDFLSIPTIQTHLDQFLAYFPEVGLCNLHVFSLSNLNARTNFYETWYFIMQLSPSQ